MKKVVLSLVAVLMLAAASAQAQVIKLSLWDDICIPNGDYTGGIEIAIGTQTKEVEGVQLAWIYAQADKMTGVQFGIVTNTNNGLGAQLGFLNLADNFKGAQLGVVNYSKSVNGLQLGFLNYTESMKGLQIGLINIIKNNSQLYWIFPIVNFAF